MADKKAKEAGLKDSGSKFVMEASCVEICTVNAEIYCAILFLTYYAIFYFPFPNSEDN